MRLPRRTLILLIALTTLVGLSGIALAEHEDAKEDTSFSFGYDEANQALIINSGPNDGLYECVFENGVLTTTYGEADENGVIPVDTLEDEEGPKEFDPTEEHFLADDLEPAEDPFVYDGADGECGASAVSVAGPNGQVNHGMFMRAFNQMLKEQDMKGRGCLVRHLANSDLGRTESTQIKTSDADPEFEMTDNGEATFLTVQADCLHGKNDPNFKNGGEEARGQGKLKAKAAKENRGKSGQAPGKNK
jgi:hypothetical protein